MKLKVLVQSFSYKWTGYPVDITKKGGGFVFDCRAIDAYDYDSRDNPDAPFEHENLNGRDHKVVTDALDKDKGTQDFFKAVWFMVKMDIEKCLRRDFKVMTANFGCTAGRHRSVYMAERLAKEIKKNFPEVEVELLHLEEFRWPTG